jgi:uncharacterized protein YbbC (DUF1343 family)
MAGVLVGLEVACAAPPEVLRRSRRFGLLSNQASVDGSFRHAAQVLHERFPRALAALFGPQHGLWSCQQDNMVETGHGTDQRLGVPVHSLYSETRKPTQQMLDGLDLLVVDLQDVGTRVYTYVWTLTHCLEACAEKRIPVLVLDRPTIPMRHGLTLGELALFCNDSMQLGADVQVVPMQGYSRSMIWPDTCRVWVPPSPNLPRFEGAFVYAGQVLLEGTNLSEGRGTTTPFEQFGAPFIDPWQLASMVGSQRLPGVALRPVHFEPTFQKWHGEPCRGLFLHVTDAATFRPYRTTLALLRATHELWPRQFGWRLPPYEYETQQMPIDILAGGDLVRTFVESRRPWSELDAVAAAPADWWQRVRSLLLY